MCCVAVPVPGSLQNGAFMDVGVGGHGPCSPGGQGAGAVGSDHCTWPQERDTARSATALCPAGKQNVDVSTPKQANQKKMENMADFIPASHGPVFLEG